MHLRTQLVQLIDHRHGCIFIFYQTAFCQLKIHQAALHARGFHRFGERGDKGAVIKLTA